MEGGSCFTWIQMSSNLDDFRRPYPLNFHHFWHEKFDVFFTNSSSNLIWVIFLVNLRRFWRKVWMSFAKNLTCPLKISKVEISWVRLLIEWFKRCVLLEEWVIPFKKFSFKFTLSFHRVYHFDYNRGNFVRFFVNFQFTYLFKFRTFLQITIALSKLIFMTSILIWKQFYNWQNIFVIFFFNSIFFMRQKIHPEI